MHLLTDKDGRDLLSLNLGQRFDIDKEPVSNHNKTLYAPLQQHLQITLELIQIILRIHDDWKIGRRLKGLLNPLENQSAKGIRDVEDHNPDNLATTAPKRAGKGIRAVSKPFRCSANQLLRLHCNMFRKWSLIQND